MQLVVRVAVEKRHVRGPTLREEALLVLGAHGAQPAAARDPEGRAVVVQPLLLGDVVPVGRDAPEGEVDAPAVLLRALRERAVARHVAGDALPAGLRRAPLLLHEDGPLQLVVHQDAVPEAPVRVLALQVVAPLEHGGPEGCVQPPPGVLDGLDPVGAPRQGHPEAGLDEVDVGDVLVQAGRKGEHQEEGEGKGQREAAVEPLPLHDDHPLQRLAVDEVGVLHRHDLHGLLRVDLGRLLDARDVALPPEELRGLVVLVDVLEVLPLEARLCGRAALQRGLPPRDVHPWHGRRGAPEKRRVRVNTPASREVPRA
mmetsp:Transcript_63524/g.137540  ORF Transcript_63524/g.137540 Transcript_63524/m.137540 type:complete len:313 (+) Transcript_63524:1569-2507(+)